MPASNATDIGGSKVLLFDDAWTERTRGVSRVQNRPDRCARPMLRPEAPWELGGIRGDSMMSFNEEEGRLLLWYSIPYLPQGVAGAKGGNVQGGEGLDEKTLADLRGAERRHALCFATSTDGVEWERPVCDLYEFQGSKRNNIVQVGRMACSVFRDPTARRSERFKMVMGGGPNLPHIHLEGDIPVKHIYHGIYGATSPDGIHWKQTRKPICPWYTDTTNAGYYDDQKGKYAIFVRWNANMYYEDGKTVTPNAEWRLRYRAAGRSESEDFRNFPRPEVILEPTEEERRRYETGMDIYNTAAHKYPWAPDAYFLFSSHFYHEPDTLDVWLYTSRDGVRYERGPEPYLRLGPAGRFDSGSVYMASGMVRRGDEVWMAYAGYDHTHRGVYHRKPFSGGAGLARIRLDGFVSQDFGLGGGELVTKPLRFDGSALALNMDGSAGGSLRVEVQAPDGRALDGFGLRDADKLWNSSVAKRATWNGAGDVSSLRGKPVRLRFKGHGVKLYAFQFVDG